MKIAYDATVVHGEKSGVGYYSQELIRALAQLDGPERYWAFSHRPLSPDVVQPGARVSFASSGHFPARAVYLHAILPRLLDLESPDLVHYTNFLAPAHDRHRYVITIHDMSLEAEARWHPIVKRQYTRRLVPRSARRARLVITNSEYSKWQIVSHLGIPEDRIRVTPLAPSPVFRPPGPLERAGVRNRYRIQRPYFLYVGNIDPRKNLVRLVEAFSTGLHRDFDLVIAGRSWFGSRELRHIVRRLGLDAAVRLIGYVPRTDVAGLMGESTAFVYPSLLEGFGMPILEAMASGAPVITSRTTALGEVAGNAARLVDPEDPASIAEAMTDVARDPQLRHRLVDRGFRRSEEFSWHRTALATRAVYREALETPGGTRFVVPEPARPREVLQAVRTTCRYAAHFGFPLTPEEIHERLFAVRASLDDVASAIHSAGLPRTGDYVTGSGAMVETRLERERKTREALERRWPALEFIAGCPFVRMVALSGATAHENMADEDIDLFAVVEDGRLWFVLGVTTLWAKVRGFRRTICLNYLVSDRALPLPDTDAFTAHQLASLKPVYGKNIYDAFVRTNPFVFRAFPNFQPDRHRSRYPEIRTRRRKRWLEVFLRLGPVQISDTVAARVLGAHLRRKARMSGPETDVVLNRKRLKLHMHSHRAEALSVVAGETSKPSVANAVAGVRAPRVDQRPEQNVQIQRR